MRHTPWRLPFSMLTFAASMMPLAASRRTNTRQNAALTHDEYRSAGSVIIEHKRPLLDEDRFSHGMNIVAKHGFSSSGFIDYNQLSQAWPSPIAFLPVALIWAAALIWLLNSTAQEFFVPPLEYWCRRLNLTPQVAGATLVALGNGAPDLFAVATAAETQDLSLGFSELLGSNMCVLCMTGGVVCLFARNVYGQPLKQDDLLEAHTLPASGLEQTSFGKIGADSQINHAGTHSLHTGGSDHISGGWYCVTLFYLSLLVMIGPMSARHVIPMPAMYLFYVMSLLVAARMHSSSAKPEPFTHAHENGSTLLGLAIPSTSSPMAFVGWMLAWPTYVVRWILIPSADQQWNGCRRLFSALSPAGLALLWVACRPDDVMGWGLCVAPVAITCSLLIFVCSDSGPKVPCFYASLTLLSKVSSIVVLSLIARELTSLVQTVGLLVGIPRLWLGSTVISWGNSLGDLVTGIAMVKQGQMHAAMTAVFAGPLFNCLVGGGLALLIACAQGGGQVALGEGPAKAALLTNLGFLMLASVLATLALRSIRQQGFSWVWPWLLFALYASFLMCIMALEAGAP